MRSAQPGPGGQRSHLHGRTACGISLARAKDLLLAAGRALEASFEVEGPSAIVLAGRDAQEGSYRAAR